MPLKLFTAIAFFIQDGEKIAHKYRNISNRMRFEKFIQERGAKYVNWYDKETRQYIGRVYL